MQVTTIFGPPGTGKTRTLVGHAKEEGGGLFLSYTKAAAAEATSRLEHIKPSTLHSLAFNNLNMNRAAVVDREKLKAFSKATGIPFKGVEYGSDEDQEGDEYATVLSFARNRLIEDLEEAYDRFGQPGTRPRFTAFVTQYEDWKKAFGYMDFDDMLTMFSRRGKVNAPVVYLDEAQDCTPLQWSAFKRAVDHSKRVYIAGDDDQAIYEWNGANPRGMIEFTGHHNGEYHVLSQSHRLTQPIYDQAMTVINQIEDRRVYKKFDPKGPGPAIERWRDIEHVLNMLRDVRSGALILVRDRFKLEEVKRTLNRWMVPYDVYGGVSPWTSKVAKALQAGTLKTDSDEIPLQWRDFYRQADLKQPILFHLSTIHSAKGREHDTVVVDLECPSRVLLNLAHDRDAEVRVQYVGITRSKNRLMLCGENPIL